MRVIAILLLLAVLPTVELAEQVEHAIAHVLDAEPADHGAHHDEAPGDEHGCTGLVHLCSCHHTQVTVALAVMVSHTTESSGAVDIAAPKSLADLTTPEPAHRPPIA